MAAHQVAWVQHAMFEITLLGTGLVLMTMVAVAGTFLWLTEHRFSALLLLIATWGGVAINSLLKSTFDRPRPQVFEWGAQVLTSSFPSGHAMTATITYVNRRLSGRAFSDVDSSRWITMGRGLMIASSAPAALYPRRAHPSEVVAGH